MPALRQREHAVQAELHALMTQAAGQSAWLRLAETLTTFFERLRKNAETLGILERQRIVRLLVKEAYWIASGCSNGNEFWSVVRGVPPQR
jgi:site-specific DNA recombinase